MLKKLGDIMRNDICTIPVTEIFEINDGCPICRMKKIIEERMVDYIMGDAMMEPDIRIETNKVGFCPSHYDIMFEHKGRLQLALMLQTHIDEINKEIFSSKKASKGSKISESCFICDKIERGMSRLIETIYRTYEKEEEFREMFNAQPMFCLSHYERLVNGAEKKLLKKQYNSFLQNINNIENKYANELYGKISKFCNMYDYRSRDKNEDYSDCTDAVEKGIEFLK